MYAKSNILMLQLYSVFDYFGFLFLKPPDFVNLFFPSEYIFLCSITFFLKSVLIKCHLYFAPFMFYLVHYEEGLHRHCLLFNPFM